MEWQPIETAPEKTDILTFAEWGSPQIGVSRYEWVEETRQSVESESHNKKGRRYVIQETEVRVREWHGEHSEPTHWMPLPDPPTL
jgi:hypothetical protein